MAGKKKKNSAAEDDFMKKRKELFEDKEVKDISSDGADEVPNEESHDSTYSVSEDSEQAQGSIDDINELLRKMGLEPIPVVDDVKTSQEKTSDEKVSESNSNEKTKHFNPIGSSPKKIDFSEIDDEAPAFKPSRETDESDQIIFNGFEDEVVPSRVSEKEVEEQLQKSRKKFIENFRVLSKNERDKAILEKNHTGAGAESIFDSVEVKKGEMVFDAVERAGESGKSKNKKQSDEELLAARKKAQKEKRNRDLISAKKIKQTLYDKSKSQRIRTLILLILFAVTLVLNIIASIQMKSEEPIALFKNGARIYTAINIALLLACFVICFENMKKGLIAMRSYIVNVNTCVLITNCFVLIHSIAMLISGMNAESGVFNFTLCAIFAMFSVSFSELLRLKCVSDDISVMMRSKELRGIGTVENKNEVAAIMEGAAKKEEQKLVYSTDIDFQNNYDEIASSYTAHEKVYAYMGIVAVVAGLTLAVTSSVLQKNSAVFATGFASSFCLCAPFMRQLISVMLKSKSNGVNFESGVIISGYDCARTIGKANAVIVDTDEVFTASVSKFRTVPGGKMVRSDAVVYAAATLKGSRSILRNTFDDYLESVGIELPEAEDLQYEDKLGYSCWVVGRRVLVGTRKMLAMHSIPAPSEEEERQYESSRSVLYVVVEGKIAATFVVSYNVKSGVKDIFRSLNKSSLVMIMNTGDPSLDEKLVSEKLIADVASIKIVKSKASRIIERCKSRNSSTLQTGLLYPKAQKNSLHLFYAAHNLYIAEKFAGIIYHCGLALSLALVAVCIILNISSFLTSVSIVLIQLLWSFVAYFIGSLRIK